MKIKKVMCLLLAFSACLAFTACSDTASSKTENTNGDNTSTTNETLITGIQIKELSNGYRSGKELLQNDYRGGVMRADVVKNTVLKTIDTLKKGNIAIRSDNPNSYWTAEGYQDFVANFFSTSIINDTQWINEEETDLATVITQMTSTANSFTKTNDNGEYVSKYPNLNVSRNEKDDYEISGTTTVLKGSTSNTNTAYRILYDCDKDWCKAVCTANVNVDAIKNPVTTQMFEYARLDNNTFVIQTETERLVTIFEPTTEDTDLRERQLKEFYYSRLAVNCNRTGFKAFEPLSEVDENEAYSAENAQINATMKNYPYINQDGEQASYYGTKNSLFLVDKGSLNKEWVFEDKALQQAISYKDNNLIVLNYNKLAEKYEQFVYYKDKAPSDDEVKKIVDVSKLVGDNVKVENNSSNKPSTSKPTTSSETPNTSNNSITLDTSSNNDTSSNISASESSRGNDTTTSIPDDMPMPEESEN